MVRDKSEADINFAKDPKVRIRVLSELSKRKSVRNQELPVHHFQFD